MVASHTEAASSLTKANLYLNGACCPFASAITYLWNVQAMFLFPGSSEHRQRALCGDHSPLMATELIVDNQILHPPP